MTLYLGSWVDVNDLKDNALRCGVQGVSSVWSKCQISTRVCCVEVKSYPKGVTTNSESGVESYEPYFPIFEVMQELGLSLHLHGTNITEIGILFICDLYFLCNLGEMPGEDPLQAEQAFLPELVKVRAMKRFLSYVKHIIQCFFSMCCLWVTDC